MSLSVGRMRSSVTAVVLACTVWPYSPHSPYQPQPTDLAILESIIARTAPLDAPRGDRLPLYVWPAHRLGTDEPVDMERLIRALDARGMAVFGVWNPEDPAALDRALAIGRIQHRLGLPISISATSATYAFFDGDPRTAHITRDGRPFFDESFDPSRPMGCPFAIDSRLPAMRRRIAEPVAAYRAARLTIHFVYADWEIDGPIEWNGAWDASRRCARCRQHIADIDDFPSFQTAIRTKRAALQRGMLAEPVLEAFPQALVGNYGVHPHDGFRYWFDYFETFVEGAPHRLEARARYRRWFDEFPLTGYTFAMATVYPWYEIFDWYDFDVPEYRWFYNMLLVGSNVGKSTPAEAPIVTFVHWTPVEAPADADPAARGLDRSRYQELLWHLLLRGHDALFSWSRPEEGVEETVVLQEVYAASHGYRNFLRDGVPVTFDVPTTPGPVVSGLRLGDRVLMLRSDFDDTQALVRIDVGGRLVQVPRATGPQLLRID